MSKTKAPRRPKPTRGTEPIIAEDAVLRSKVNDLMCKAISAARYNNPGWLDTQADVEEQIMQLHSAAVEAAVEKVLDRVEKEVVTKDGTRHTSDCGAYYQESCTCGLWLSKDTKAEQRAALQSMREGM